MLDILTLVHVPFFQEMNLLFTLKYINIYLNGSLIEDIKQLKSFCFNIWTTSESLNKSRESASYPKHQSLQVKSIL